MKKIIAIAFAAIIAGLAISCQKEEAVSDKADAVQYTFNITVADQVGFESDVSTKKASAPTYKSAWENGDKIFLFFKPTSGNLLTDTYATLTYNGSSWNGAKTGTTSLGNGGTLSAVYVYKLDGSVTPAYSDSKWTIATGNTFYNCQTGVDYTVSGSEISASLNLVAPDDFVCFSIYDTSGDALTCNNVKGWKDVVIGSEMTFSNATCTGYMTGFDNIGGSNYKDYYGRIVGGGTSLNGLPCNFSVVQAGKVYERTATPSSDKRSFYMDRRATGDKKWTEAAGKLPGLFTVGIGADGKAGTADDVQVRFSQGNLKYDDSKWKFYDHQYDYLKGLENSPVSLFPWGYDATKNIHLGSSECVKTHNKKGDKLVYDKASSEGGDDWGVAYCESNSIDVGTWRTLSKEEWVYLINTRTMTNGKARYSIPEYGVTIGSTTYGGLFLYPDNYNGEVVSGSMTLDAINAAGIVFLPAAGYYEGGEVKTYETEGFYWSSSAYSEYSSYLMYFQNTGNVTPDKGNDEYDDCKREKNYSVRLVTEVK